MRHWMTRPGWWMLWLGLVVVVAYQPALAEQQRVAVCHRPPGNPADFEILFLPPPAVAAHLAHGDNVMHSEGVDSPGTCTDGIDNDCDGLIDSADPKCTPSCTANGGPCDLTNPGACCSRCCMSLVGGGPPSVCCNF